MLPIEKRENGFFIIPVLELDVQIFRDVLFCKDICILWLMATQESLLCIFHLLKKYGVQSI